MGVVCGFLESSHKITYVWYQNMRIYHVLEKYDVITKKTNQSMGVVCGFLESSHKITYVWYQNIKR